MEAMGTLLTDLLRNALQVRQSEVRLVPILFVVLLKLIQICSEQLTHKEQVFLHRRITSIPEN